MEGLPEAVSKAFDKVKQTADASLVLRQLNGHYYVYKSHSEWDKANKKVITTQEYIGRITGRGAFIKKSERWVGNNLKRALQVATAHGWQVTPPQEPHVASHEQLRRELDLSEADKQILTILSMNARSPVSFIAKRTGLTRSAVLTKIRHFEEKYGMRYILEVDIRKLGFRPYMIMAKFGEKRPSAELLREIVTKEPRIQYAALLKGTYDMVVYWLDDIESLEIADDLWNFEINEKLKGYSIQWDVTPFGQVQSFVPLREEFIEDILRKKTWPSGEKFLPEKKNTEDLYKPLRAEVIVEAWGEKARVARKPSLKERELRAREFILIRELNRNSTEDFKEIDEEFGWGKGNASRYSYLELKRRGVLVRPTISLDSPPIKYTAIILSRTVNAVETNDNLYKLRLDAIEYGPITNKYVLTGNVGWYSGGVQFIPIYRENELENTTETLNRTVSGTLFENLIITETLVGTLCYRRFDNSYSRQYTALVSLKKIKQKELVNYEDQTPTVPKRI